MNEKTWGIVLGIVNIVLLMVCGVFFLGKDKKAPEILLSNAGFVYAARMEEEELFQGVTAFDEEDGELTDSVVIEKIVTDTEKETATITYGVVDNSGNVGKVTCTVAMDVPEYEESFSEENSENEEEDFTGIDLENADAEEEETEDSADSEENEAEGSEADIETEESEDNEDSEDGEGEEGSVDSEGENAESEGEPEALPTAGEASNQGQNVGSRPNPRRPTIVFRSQEVKVRAGQSPAWVNVIEGLHDDKDNYETLLKSLKIKGDYDKSKAGTYNVTVTVTDGEGNESNAYPMKIVVEAWE